MRSGSQGFTSCTYPLHAPPPVSLCSQSASGGTMERTVVPGCGQGLKPGSNLGGRDAAAAGEVSSQAVLWCPEMFPLWHGPGRSQ